MSEAPRDPAPDEAPVDSPAEPPREELPKQVSYSVIGITVLAIGGYAIYAAMNPGPVPELPGATTGPAGPVDPGPQFTLEPSLVDKASIVAGGPPRDGVPALVDPKFMSVAEAGLDDRLRVVGVEINDDARAYPVAIMNYHEAVNDTVGGKKIVVTFCPLCDLARAFERQVGDETLEFGVSGRLMNANMLLFDRRESIEQESLWSQIEGRAITGPQAGKAATLTSLGAEITSLGVWRAAHPSTKVLSPNTGHKFDYKTSPYARYLTSDEVGFPLPKRSGRHAKAKNKSHLAVVSAGDERRAYFFKDLKAAGGPVTDRLGDAQFTLTYDGKGVHIAGDPSVESFTAFWFAVDLLTPQVPVWDGKPTGVTAATGAAGASGATGAPAPTGAAAPTAAPAASGAPSPG